MEEFNGVQKSSIQIRNTGNIEAYLRIKLVSYWVDGEGNVAPKASQMPAISLASGWVKGTGNTYYWNTPVAPSGNTGNLLAAPIVLEEDGEGNRQVLEIFAEAIQGAPTAAVTDSWGVTLSGDGSIIKAP